MDIFSEAFDDYTGFDIAMCFEVGEHLPEYRAREFISKVTQVAPIIYFTAAQPGQGGYGHKNCQPVSYWIELFMERNFIYDQEETINFTRHIISGRHMG